MSEATKADTIARRRVGLISDIKGAIRQAANERGLTIAMLASASGMSDRAVRRVLNPSTDITIAEIFALTDAMGLECQLELTQGLITPREILIATTG